MRMRLVQSVLLASMLAAVVQPLPAADMSPSSESPSTFNRQRFVRHLSGMETCLLCHGSFNLIVKRPNDPRHSLWIDSKLFLKSVHAQLGCTACHTNIDSFGHRLAGAPVGAQSCEPCHLKRGGPKMRSETQPGGAEQEQEKRLTEMFVMRGYDLTLTTAMRACVKCHEQEFNLYSESVHGQAVLHRQNSDAPFCMDCHGIHYILPHTDPESLTNPLNVPSTCLRCHDQADIKARAGLNQDIKTSFQQSFHGKRSALGRISVAVCNSCHGTHDIYAVNDPRSRVNQARIAKTCGRCHEGAQLNFASAFTHRSVSPREQLGLYILKQVYKWVIFLLIAQFALFAALDVFRHFQRRSRGSKAHA